MKTSEIRRAFFDFFESRSHQIVPSAPMVVKNDPTLMFTNAGMNQFKDIFLGNSPVQWSRIADSQKCLRVSGKHNDLEEVGHDTYHHTMFEMLGNWSFGDYFKEEAIRWAWEFLTDVVKLDPARMYATVFEGSPEEGIAFDQEAFDHWRRFLPEDRILKGNKKDNFWEMGDTGPCGPCSEIHIDLRDASDRQGLSGRDLVNTGHPLVIEIWNLVFIQFNRKASGELEKLPMQHVDTGMGFERLCMAIQGKKSNYDTGVFQPIIGELAKLCGIAYGADPKADVAMRVVADHLRAISFSIADGQLPSNVRAGYVIRRILRRAVRYGFTFLNTTEPFIHKLLPVLIETMGDAYPELVRQESLISKVIAEEEASFLRTLETGIRKLDQSMERLRQKGERTMDGAEAFELYDTYGFPLDLTELILRENQFEVDREGFDREMEVQKSRSRSAAVQETDDWNRLRDGETDEFVGYDHLEGPLHITRWRKVKTKGKEFFQLVFDRTPFYAESGGQVGDTGLLRSPEGQIRIVDTVKENNLTIHLTTGLPENLEGPFHAQVDRDKRQETANNHSATHLLHFALRQVLGSHVEQKGSAVDPERLRFDFSHFQKVTDEELVRIEEIVNQMIREDHRRDENRQASMEEAQAQGAMALFGEKYGDRVRVIRFGPSVELCGGTHVEGTGQIGLVKIVSESAIAAGIRRIEAISGPAAFRYVREKLDTLREMALLLRNPKDPVVALNALVDENARLQKQVEQLRREKGAILKKDLLARIQPVNGINLLIEQVETDSEAVLKEIAYQIRQEVPNLFFVAGADLEGKALLMVMFADELMASKKLNASAIIRDLAREVQGGGGGQAFFATAGGKNPAGIPAALQKATDLAHSLA